MGASETPAVGLTVDRVWKTYESAAGASDVLKGVDLAIEPGQTVAIVGASGCGKSTLLNIVGSLDRPTSGAVRLGDLDITLLVGDELADYRRHKVGFVFQDHHLLPQCTALENVALPTIAAHTAIRPVGGRTAGSGRAGMDRAGQLLGRVGLGDRGGDFPQKLSGGERQRVAIARALVNEPPLVLCDEPTGNLDRLTAESVAALFAELAAERNVMLMIVTHNLELADRFSRRLELRDGVLHDAGGP